MEIEMKMPDLGTTTDEIKVVEWLIELGQEVKRGEALLSVETDKATMNVESFASGKLTKVLVEEDDEVAAGEVIALIESEDAVPEKVNNAQPEKQLEESPASSLSVPETVDKKVRGGMFAKNRQAASARQTMPQSSGQGIVAQRMQESKQTIPHFYLQTSINAEAMQEKRKAAAEKIIWDAFFVSACALALQKFERLKFRYENQQLVASDTEAVGVAVDLDGDLYVVSLENPEAKTVEDISRQIREKVQLIRDDVQEAKRMSPANMTITNLGMTNTESFIAIVNPPESCILSVGKISQVPVVLDNGTLATQSRAVITLSIDHRIVNGKYAADFLSEIVKQLENI